MAGAVGSAAAQEPEGGWDGQQQAREPEGNDEEAGGLRGPLAAADDAEEAEAFSLAGGDSALDRFEVACLLECVVTAEVSPLVRVAGHGGGGGEIEEAAAARVEVLAAAVGEAVDLVGGPVAADPQGGRCGEEQEGEGGEDVERPSLHAAIV